MFGVGENPVYLDRVAAREEKRRLSGSAQAEAEQLRRDAMIMDGLMGVEAAVGGEEAEEASSDALGASLNTSAEAAAGGAAEAEAGVAAVAAAGAAIDGDLGIGLDTGPSAALDATLDATLDALFADPLDDDDGDEDAPPPGFGA